MKGLLIDNGSRWLVYTCVGEIELGKVIRGRVDDNFITQIKALGYTFSIEKGMYSMGEKIEEVE
ncbi:hypothetical protein D3C71_1994850 [compost metagenome]